MSDQLETLGDVRDVIVTYGGAERDLPFKVYDANTGAEMRAVDIYSDAEGVYLDVERVED